MTTHPSLRTLLAAAALGILGATGQAADVSYSATLSEGDHYNSAGDRLTSVSQVLRQDRANYHDIGGDAGDSGDQGAFGSKGKRALFDRARIKLEGVSASEIINGTPEVSVRVEGNTIVVSGS